MELVHQNVSAAETNFAQRLSTRALAGAIALSAAAGVLYEAPASATASNICADKPKILNIVAHEDDDLLFTNPDTQHDIHAGDCLRTVFLTAGDAGKGQPYWSKREVGIHAAYARMAGTANDWSRVRINENGHRIVKDQLKSDPKVTVMFMRLPDGGIPGTGYKSTGYTSLKKLWKDKISSMRAVDHSTHYTKNGLVKTLATIMNSYSPTRINTLNTHGTFGDGDHTDHVATAYFTETADTLTGKDYPLVSYLGYPMKKKPVDLTETQIKRKQRAFFVYENVVKGICQSTAKCGWDYGAWLLRRYLSQ